jgi:RNA polymerase sigma factor (sigma-70 family)
MTDEQLLSQYCTDRSESAFAELVDRHLGWVRGVAARGLGADSSLVDDVSQAVFIALAKKARSLNGRLPLSGWLFRATRYTVAHVRRAEQRRKKHEQEAKPMSEGTIDAKWLELAPLLDELMAALSEQDRRVVLSRFYSQKTFAEVGSEIGVSEEAARARVNRAVEKLRSMFARRGVTTPAVAALSALIVDHVIVPTSTAHAAAAVHAVFHPSSLSKAQTIAKQTLRGISISRLAPVAVMLAVIAMTVGIFIDPSPSHSNCQLPLPAR